MSLSTGTAKPLILLIEGESLFSDGASIITFDAFKDLATDLSHFEGTMYSICEITVVSIFGFKEGIFCNHVNVFIPQQQLSPSS